MPYVAARKLERAGRDAGFKRSNRASVERIAALHISVSPLKEQEKVVMRVEKLEKEISAAEQKLAASVSAKAAILDKYLK